MRQIVRPRFGVVRDLHSKNAEPHVGHVTSRSALLVIALGVACLGLPATSAVAQSNTTSMTIAGNAYARNLLRLQPIPPGAQRVTTLPTPLRQNSAVAIDSVTSHAWSLFLLSTSVSVSEYVRDHLPSGETVTGTGTSGGPHVVPVDSLVLSLTCVSPHITFCGVAYSTTVAKSGQRELRVDVDVTYLPIVHEQMPTTGTVTVTGYGKTSLAQGSSDPVTVVLSHQQVLSLHTVVADLKDFGGGECMEDSTLLKIKIVRSGVDVWNATADECPGSLFITTPHSTTYLDDHSCSFWHVIDSLFAPGTAKGTTAGSATCSTEE